MQASKILPRKTYAIRRNGELVRFYVTAVVTRREKATGSPHDHKSVIEGHVHEASEPRSDNGTLPLIVVNPEAVLGPFEEYVELAARKKAEEDAREHEKALREDARTRLWTLLYERTGRPRPNDPKIHSQPFRITYSGIDVTDDGVKLLTELLSQQQEQNQ
jgi:hypothetical protein